MSTWYSKQLGDGVAAYGPTGQIQKAFIKLREMRAATGQENSDVAVFSRYDQHENVVTVYFTPSAQPLAEGFRATPCEKPAPSEGLELLVGDANSWETHFPGYKA